MANWPLSQPDDITCMSLLYCTGVFVNIMMSMVKRFLPKNMNDKLQFGCTFPDRLDKCFLTPNPKVAKERNYLRIIETLKVRYENEANFRL